MRVPGFVHSPLLPEGVRGTESHQLWHMCVIGAAMILWTGLREYAGYRAAAACPA